MLTTSRRPFHFARPVPEPTSIRRTHSRKHFFYQSLFFGTNVDTTDVIQCVRDHRYRIAIFIFGNIDFLQY
ncbi:hypothetical protein DF038_32275 [Burkholderia cepacia]|nr:hypothetical protein C5O75_027050 [Burkholderia cepacia]RQT62868.1 hypothetical protein DF045_36145 [Burkholderia cepacia]RQT89727.1 hypothetical protein DF023_00255 [Burkholderia cepacia]RQU08920.1 hypothetical protein DF022_03735 [Burkholderia cepacia]RQZ84719.1 hypothetical protein DF056_00255 [Burkholderia cepacia]